MSKSTLDQEVILHRITNRIRHSLELQEILATTVAEVRSILSTDRVMVYQFHADASGEVIAEAIQDQRLPSLLGLNFPADDIPVHKRELFLRANGLLLTLPPNKLASVRSIPWKENRC